MAGGNFNQKTEIVRDKIQSSAFIISVFISVLFSIYFSASGFQRPEAISIQLDEKINPNDAPVASLVRLPGIGIGLAKTIENYRQEHADKDGNSPVFQSSQDLRKIKGIGPKIVQNMEQWLKFNKDREEIKDGRMGN